MKLIMDIPEEEYKRMKEQSMFGKVDIWKQAFKNGTPLDDVKAEIDEQYDRIRPYNIDIAEGLEMALDILDNIGKAESEDKE